MGKPGWLLLWTAALLGPALAAEAPRDTRPARAAMALYVKYFDNAYLTASKDRRLTGEAPYDAAAAALAQDIHDQAQDRCEQAQFSTSHARMECFLDADQAFANAAKVDATLLSTFKTAVRRAADDADSGKLPAEQLDNIYFLISEAYASIIHDQYAAWSKAHPAHP